MNMKRHLTDAEISTLQNAIKAAQSVYRDVIAGLTDDGLKRQFTRQIEQCERLYNAIEEAEALTLS